MSAPDGPVWSLEPTAANTSRAISLTAFENSWFRRLEGRHRSELGGDECFSGPRRMG